MYSTLSLGSQGHEVELLQRALRDLGYEVGPIDGDFGSQTQSALSSFGLDQDIDQSVEPNGVCGELTWASLQANLGDLEGMRSEELVEDYVEGAIDAFNDEMSAEDRLAAIEAELHQAILSAGVPTVRLYFDETMGDGGDYAVFYPPEWQIGVNQVYFQQDRVATMTSIGMAEVAGAVYNQGREAEQWFQIAQLLAGKHQMGHEQIAEAMEIPSGIAEIAYQHPITDNPLHSGAVYDWYIQHFVDPNAEETGRDLLDADGAIHREWREHTEGAAAISRPTLRRGDYNNDEVRYLQELLQWRSLYLGHAVDGDFGPYTQEAVKQFQAAHNLDDDGIVGERTWEALLP